MPNGFKPLLIGLACMIGFYAIGFNFLSFLSLLFVVATVLFFLNAEREPEEEDNLSIIAPLDGKIEAINTHDDNMHIEISSFVTDSHVVRSPLCSSIVSHSKRIGINLFTKNPLYEKLNTKLNFYFQKDGYHFSLLLTEGFLHSKIRTFAQDNAQVKLGKRIAFFNASKAKFICPQNIDLKICVGDNIRSGETLIGFIKQ